MAPFFSVNFVVNLLHAYLTFLMILCLFQTVESSAREFSGKDKLSSLTANVVCSVRNSMFC